jgi:quinoprotein glucose dehydrogenase
MPPAARCARSDARTGALRWVWDPVPQDSTDPGWRTWIGAAAHRTGAANAWSVIAVDSARGLVFIPTGSASPDYFGGERKGQNLYANSIVALQAETGRMVWHFQTVHHDLWDYDNASPPALTTITRNGRSVPVVLQTGKTGMLFVLDRETGVPVYPVEERSVPASTVPGEEAWPTQPFTAAIAPLSPHRMIAEDAWGPTPGDRTACRDKMKSLRNEGIFTPPSLEGTLAVPSNIGGAHWGGLAVDAARQLAIIPVNRIPAEVQIIPREEYQRRRNETGYRLEGSQYTDMRGTPYVMRRSILFGPSGAPCSAASLRHTGGGRPHDRCQEMGSAARHHRGGRTTRTGQPESGRPDRHRGWPGLHRGNTGPKIRAYDVDTGQELWSAALPAGGKATPMTYLGRDGRQYLVIAAGGDGGRFGKSDRVVAFAVK